MARFLMFLTRCALLAAPVLLLAPAPAGAQTPTGTIVGRVSDQNDAIVRGAVVTIASPSLQGTPRTTTSQNGDYTFQSLLPGSYTVTVQMPGFTTVERTVHVAPAERVTVNVTLQAAPLTEAVTVV